MSLSKIVVVLTRDDYDAIKRLARDDEGLPDTYDEWLDLKTDEITKLKSQGIAYKQVVIDSDGLGEYCKASGITSDTVGRNSYAVYIDRSGQYPSKKPS